MDKLLSNNRLLVGAGAAVLIIGALWLMTRGEARDPFANVHSSEDTKQEQTTNTSSTSSAHNNVNSTISNDESVSVADQPAGDTVTIASVTFTEVGWVAVRDDRGWTLGAKRFEPGTHSNVAMSLLRATEAGQRYQVLLYIDDGDGAFDLDKEILVTRSDGSVAGVTFTTTAAETKTE